MTIFNLAIQLKFAKSPNLNHRQYFYSYGIYSTLINDYCIDVNECAGDHGCQHLCNNTDGSFNCYCNAGYLLDSNGTNCTG